MNSFNTIIDHRKRIRRVTNYINQHLDVRLTLPQLAKIACYSSYHFIRVFELLLGETPCQYIVRKKMERAGSLLLQNLDSITDVALHLAYGTPSSFCKTFSTQFGMSPRQFRDSVSIEQYRKTNHPFRALTGNQNQSESVLKPTIRKLPEMGFLCLENQGARNGTFLETALTSFERFKRKINQNGLGDITCRSASIYPYRPIHFHDDQVKNLVGAVVNRVPSSAEELDFLTLPEGRYAIFDHYGSYDFIGQTWNQIYMNWYPKSGMHLRAEPPLEIHLEADASENSLELVAHVLIPIQ